MARGINKVIIVGNLGADPETRYTGSGTAITSLRIATSEAWTDKQSGEKQERTEWHRVKLFGKLAEIAGEYLKKGRQVYIEGSLRTDKYTDKDGIERYSTDIIANEMQMLGGQGGGEGGERTGRPAGERRGSASGTYPGTGGGSSYGAPRERPRENQMPGPGGRSFGEPRSQDTDGFDEDTIPF